MLPLQASTESEAVVSATGQRIRPGRIVRDAGLFSLVAVAGFAFPIATGLATGPHDAPATVGELERIGADVEKRASDVRVELKTLSHHAWAGDYYQGDGLGANVRLVLAPKTGVAATWHGCLGLYGANAGAVTQSSDGTLEFQFEYPNEKGFGGFPDHVVPVRWGDRRYLLAPTQMADFVAAINHGREPRPQAWGTFLLADGDESRRVSGLPDLPAEYRDAIRSTPVLARVLTVEPLGNESRFESSCDRRYRLHVAVADGALLRDDEALEASGPSNPFGRFLILDARPGRAVVIAKMYESDCAKPEQVPRKGWTLTTGAYDPAAANAAIEQAASERPRR